MRYLRDSSQCRMMLLRENIDSYISTAHTTALYCYGSHLDLEKYDNKTYVLSQAVAQRPAGCISTQRP